MGNIGDCSRAQQQELLDAYGFYFISKHYGPNFALIERKITKSKTQKLKHGTIFNKKLRVLQKSNNIVPLIKFDFEQDDYCYKLILVYPLVFDTLATRFKTLQQQISQQQLLKLISDISAALKSFEQNGYKHNHLNMKTILYEKGTYLLTDIGSMKGLNSYDQAFKGSVSELLLLSPCLMSQLKDCCMNPKLTIHDDLFSLGMICLMLMVNKPSTIFYNWNEKIVKEKVVDYHLMEAAKKYSSVVIRKVKELLNQGRWSEEQTQSKRQTTAEKSIIIHQNFIDINQRLQNFQERRE